MFKFMEKCTILGVFLVASAIASPASAQSYNEKIDGDFTFHAYQPQPIDDGERVEGMAVAMATPSRSSNWCAYLYKNGRSIQGICNYVSGSRPPDVITIDGQCNPRATITWQTRVVRVGSSWELFSPPLVTHCP